MTLFERVHMPSLGGATEWLNSEPLGPAELRSRVVLVAVSVFPGEQYQAPRSWTERA